MQVGVCGPNQALEPTASSVRCTPASGGGSLLAFGFNGKKKVDRKPT
jgi:hypothetical protein